MSWKYLSYPLNGEAFGYGNGDRFELREIRSMCCGDTSNNSEFSMPTHYGTHIDFPFHFAENGKKSSAYTAGDFVFKHPHLIELSTDGPIEDYMIRNEHLDLSGAHEMTDLLIVKTGFTNRRYETAYWEKGYGFHPETAAFIKEALPQVRAIAFDLISLNAYQNRPLGREAHKKFLVEQDILIIEDVDLTTCFSGDQFKQVIVACLPLAEADGAPCTILAEMNED